jgi:ferredoxin
MGAREAASTPVTQLVVDWQACDGHGLCAEVIPEVVHLDEWGFPIVERPVPSNLERVAKSAVAACPKMALRLRR